MTTPHTAARTAGVALLLMAVLALLGNFVALEALVTPSDPAQTVVDIMGSQGLFRMGVASLIGVVALDVVVAWALYQVFSPVSRSVSLLAAWFRLAYSSVFLIAIGQLLGVLRLVGDVDFFGLRQVQVQAALALGAFSDLWSAGLVLFGIHLVILGYLAHRSGFVPRTLSILLALAGAGYIFDSLAAVVIQTPVPEVTLVTFVGELAFAVWLVARGSVGGGVPRQQGDGQQLSNELDQAGGREQRDRVIG